MEYDAHEKRAYCSNAEYELPGISEGQEFAKEERGDQDADGVKGVGDVEVFARVFGVNVDDQGIDEGFGESAANASDHEGQDEHGVAVGIADHEKADGEEILSPDHKLFFAPFAREDARQD